MASALGLNDHHQSTVVQYMRFARYQRNQRLKSVDGCFEDLKSSRLYEDTYTADEVTEMLDGLLAVVRSEVDGELLNTAHTNVLLLRQLFQQAEKWHLKLQANISELENKELLERIADFEEAEFAGVPRDADFGLSRLEPLNESGQSALLSMKIQELEEEKNKMKNRLGDAEKQVINVAEEKSRLAAELRAKEVELREAMQRKGQSNYDPSEVRGLQSEVSDYIQLQSNPNWENETMGLLWYTLDWFTPLLYGTRV